MDDKEGLEFSFNMEWEDVIKMFILYFASYDFLNKIIYFQEEPHFQFSTLTRSKGKKSSASSPPLDSYLLEQAGDTAVRYSTIGRSSRTNKRTALIEPELVGPRSLNRSFDNNQLYY